MNKAEITAKYCVNKDKPQMHCCGKCHLKKVLAQEDEKQNLPTMPDVKNDIQLFGSPLSVNIVYNTNDGQKIITPYTFTIAQNGQTGIFHPPQV